MSHDNMHKKRGREPNNLLLGTRGGPNDLLLGTRGGPRLDLLGKGGLLAVTGARRRARGPTCACTPQAET